MNHERLVLPENYENKLNYLDTELAIKIVKDSFEKRLAHHLNLVRVSAPLFVRNDSGLNDNLKVWSGRLVLILRISTVMWRSFIRWLNGNVWL